MQDRNGIPAQAGQRIRLIEMPNDPCPIPSGAEGIIDTVVTGFEQLIIKWDAPNDDRMLCLVPNDVYEVVR